MSNKTTWPEVYCPWPDGSREEKDAFIAILDNYDSSVPRKLFSSIGRAQPRKGKVENKKDNNDIEL